METDAEFPQTYLTTATFSIQPPFTFLQDSWLTWGQWSDMSCAVIGTTFGPIRGCCKEADFGSAQGRTSQQLLVF